ncbi:uncharacterized protein B0P05DRAFT_587912 [Gilbertella persicaria]|uniref:uncharacterized protein n=1 Tax=Gilbertella persicaria TaxID=101096 RepID=UPI002220FB0F|nr:uncharacterized protein B0P05DRAFT_587910 [Gilbertella persicaria]XP_051434005.1 uncharacterized protein B0P05DRAFT_587912 [Gilbertella persicaria]KAI8076606.1 hypothetical protein B0P05DRAFT_587910 [Gilbertella persicaria]KAI8076607.1 hypothetical protein B0P05DRAFT_587912 [Gilbertella persicaria]
MKTVVVEDSKFAIKELARPVATENTIVIKNHYSAINYADSFELKKPTTDTIGFESVGEVIEVGQGVTYYKIGDRIYQAEGKSHAEYCVLDASSASVVKIPDDVSYEDVIKFGIAHVTALALTEQSYHIKKGDYVFVTAAAGGVGSLLIQMINQNGGIAIGSVSTPEKAEYIKALGAKHVIQYKDEDILERIMEITQGRGVDAFYDSVGGSTFETGLKATRPLGHLIAFGMADTLPKPVSFHDLFARSLRLHTDSLWNYFDDKELTKALIKRLLETVHKYEMSIYKTYSLEEAPQALYDILSGKTTGRLLIKISDD